MLLSEKLCAERKRAGKFSYQKIILMQMLLLYIFSADCEKYLSDIQPRARILRGV
jgi:hypothetical protein